jgi:hypothetical protein
MRPRSSWLCPPDLAELFIGTLIATKRETLK